MSAMRAVAFCALSAQAGTVLEFQQYFELEQPAFKFKFEFEQQFGQLEPRLTSLS